MSHQLTFTIDRLCYPQSSGSSYTFALQAKGTNATTSLTISSSNVTTVGSGPIAFVPGTLDLNDQGGGDYEVEFTPDTSQGGNPLRFDLSIEVEASGTGADPYVELLLAKTSTPAEADGSPPPHTLVCASDSVTFNSTHPPSLHDTILSPDSGTYTPTLSQASGDLECGGNGVDYTISGGAGTSPGWDFGTAELIIIIFLLGPAMSPQPAKKGKESA